MREKKEIDFSYQGSADVWVSDFGTHGMAEGLNEEMGKIDIKKPKKVSWIFLSILVFILVVVLEYYLNKFATRLTWSSMAILWATWIWRFCLIMIWLFVARMKLILDYNKIIVVSFLSFVSVAVFSALTKIVFEKTLWAWLNFLVEPIWMLILVLISLVLFIKTKK